MIKCLIAGGREFCSIITYSRLLAYVNLVIYMAVHEAVLLIRSNRTFFRGRKYDNDVEGDIAVSNNGYG